MGTIDVTDTNAGAVAAWCNQRGARAVVRGGPKGGSVGGSVIITTPTARIIAEPGDRLRYTRSIGVHLTDATAPASRPPEEQP